MAIQYQSHLNMVFNHRDQTPRLLHLMHSLLCTRGQKPFHLAVQLHLFRSSEFARSEVRGTNQHSGASAQGLQCRKYHCFQALQTQSIFQMLRNPTEGGANETTPVAGYAADEADNTREDLDSEPLHQPGSVLDKNTKESRVKVFWRKFLSISVRGSKKAKNCGERTARCLSMISHLLKLEW